MQRATQPRGYIRHPCSIPIRLQASTAAEPATEAVAAEGSRIGLGQNVSRGGICCIADRRFRRGQTLKLEIDAVQPAFATEARVIWCEAVGAGRYEVGCSFLRPEDAYAARMVEQICHIEDYRQRVQAQQGRQISAEEAAREWIALYARGFPGGEH